jgi:hypothetical protein
VIATATVPVNELIDAAVALTGKPAAPPTIVNVVGDKVSEKSGGSAVMVAATVAEWLSAPDVPIRVNVALPAAALAAAVTVTLCAAPGVRVSVAGCAVTPAGSPVIATVTVPAKPLAAAAFTLIACPVPPGTSVMFAGVAATEKSATGVGDWTDVGGWLPPQDIRTRPKSSPEHPTRVLKNPMSPPEIGLQKSTSTWLRAPTASDRHYTEGHR